MPLTDRGFTRVTLLNSLTSLSAPTVAEINAGFNLTPNLAALDGAVTESTADRTPWKGNQDVQVPIRFSRTFVVRGYRETAGVPDMAYTLMAYRSSKVLVVRRGIAYATAFAAGQPVETYRIRIGKRNTLGVSESVSSSRWECTLYVTSENDAALVM